MGDVFIRLSFLEDYAIATAIHVAKEIGEIIFSFG